MFTEQEERIILTLLANLTFKTGQGAVLNVVETIVRKIEEKYKIKPEPNNVNNGSKKEEKEKVK